MADNSNDITKLVKDRKAKLRVDIQKKKKGLKDLIKESRKKVQVSSTLARIEV